MCLLLLCYSLFNYCLILLARLIVNRTYITYWNASSMAKLASNALGMVRNLKTYKWRRAHAEREFSLWFCSLSINHVKDREYCHSSNG